jgi:hypothetical protein
VLDNGLADGRNCLPQSHGTIPLISVSIDHDALATGLGEGLLEGGGSLSAAAVRRLACDAEILPFVLGSKSQILDVGRASRLVTVAIWLALVLRDRHCAFPGCTRPPIACDAHQSSTGSRADPPAWTTWCCCAAPTTRWSTRHRGRSGSARTTGHPSSFHHPGSILSDDRDDDNPCANEEAHRRPPTVG